MLWFLGASRLAIITSISKSYLILRFRLFGQKWSFATVCTTSMVSFVLLFSPLPKEQKMAEVCAINYSVCWKPLPIKTSLCFIRKQLLGDPRSSCKNYDSWTHCLVRIICPVIPKVAFLGWIKTWGKLSALPTFFGLATLEIRKPSEHLVNLQGNQLTSTVKWSEVLLIGAKLKTASSLMSSVCWSRRLEVDDEELSPPSKSLTRTSNSSSSSASMASTASTASSSLLRSRDAVKTWSKRTEWVWQKQSIINFKIRNSVHLFSPPTLHFTYIHHFICYTVHLLSSLPTINST